MDTFKVLKTKIKKQSKKYQDENDVHGQMKGYERHPDEFSEVPWGNLKNNVFLHNYLRENNMASLIPKTFL